MLKFLLLFLSLVCLTPDAFADGFSTTAFHSDYKRHCYVQPRLVGNTAFDSVGNAPTLAGNAAAAIHNGILVTPLTTAATTNSDAQVGGQPNTTATALAPIYTAIVIPITTTNVRLSVGLASGTSIASDTPGNQQMVFKYTTAAGNTTWHCYTGASGAATDTDSGVAVTANVTYRMMIDATNSSSIKFYINGVLVATHTTNLPVTTTAIGWSTGIRTLADSAASFEVGRQAIDTY